MKIFNFFRSLLLLFMITLLTLIFSLAAIIASYILRWPAVKLQRVPIRWGRIVLGMSGVSVKIVGLEKLDPSRSYIFAANHQSQFDIFTLQAYFGFDFRWLAKKELFQIPFFGKAMLRADHIPVDRGRSRQAFKSLEEAARQIAAGTSVIIFPEGTRSKDGRLQPFKPGAMVLAIKAGVPLVPVAILGTHEILPKGCWLPKRGHVLIRVGEAIETSGYGTKQKHELAERLHGAVAGLMGGEHPADKSSV